MSFCLWSAVISVFVFVMLRMCVNCLMCSVFDVRFFVGCMCCVLCIYIFGYRCDVINCCVYVLCCVCIVYVMYWYVFVLGVTPSCVCWCRSWCFVCCGRVCLLVFVWHCCNWWFFCCMCFALIMFYIICLYIY